MLEFSKPCLLRGFFFACIFVLHFTALTFAFSGEKNNIALLSLLSDARHQNLHKNPHWLKLLHYHNGHGESDIDGGYFFLSPKGKTDPWAELEATLRAFLSVDDLSPNLPDEMKEAKMHPLCKFRARLHFLKAHLNFSDSLLPPIDCERFLKWRRALNPKSVSLIFASSYLNNPASMFGHTFLRLDAHPSGDDRALLNYGITYSAAVPPYDNLIFIYKGVFGKYKGVYGMVPYYFSLQKYSNLENRDIWEYELSLDSNEVDYLLEHVWELGACWMQYYFFDENCSYNIASLLDAAKPEWNLVESLGSGIVVPTEAVKRITEVKGRVRNINWRPSLLSRFRIKADTVSPRVKELITNWVYRPSDSLVSSDHYYGSEIIDTTKSIDLALDYLQYRKRKAKPKDLAPWNARQRALARIPWR